MLTLSFPCVISPLPCSVPILLSLGVIVPSLGITLLFPRRIPGLILPRIPLLLRTGISVLLLLGIPSVLLLGISLLSVLGMLLLLPLGLPMLFPLRSAVLLSGNITFFLIYIWVRNLLFFQCIIFKNCSLISLNFCMLN